MAHGENGYQLKGWKRDAISRLHKKYIMFLGG